MLHLILYILSKYENYFMFNLVDMTDPSDEMVQKYRRLKEIYEECTQKEYSYEETKRLHGKEVEQLRLDIKRREFVCKVDRVAFSGGMKMIARFWGDYYAEIDFEEVLKIPEVLESHPDYERLREPEFFHQVHPWEYHVFFGTHPDGCDVTSHFIWHYGKRIRDLDVQQYEWVKGF